MSKLIFKGEFPPYLTHKTWTMPPAYEWLLFGARSERTIAEPGYEICCKSNNGQTVAVRFACLHGRDRLLACTVVATIEGTYECTCEQSMIRLNRLDFPADFGCKHVEFVRACLLLEPDRILQAYEQASGDLFHSRLAPALPFPIFKWGDGRLTVPPIAEYPTDDPTSLSEIDPFLPKEAQNV